MPRFEIRMSPATAEELGLERTSAPAVDVAASVARYDQLLEARIREVYPDAEIVWSERGLQVLSYAAATDVNPATGEAAEVMMGVSELAEGLFNDGVAWRVER